MRSTSPSNRLSDLLVVRLGRWAPARPWAVACSGGRDSMTLVALMRRAFPDEPLTILYVDHGWRPDAERQAEADLVSREAHRWSCSLVAAGPPTDPERTEAAARAHRYAHFEAWAHRTGGSVFLAHHADDQAETILMRLLKGRSWQGLAGMPSRRGPYHRPWLTVPRGLIAEAAAEAGVEWHEDSTNRTTDWQRNYLRQAVFPLLTGRFPGAVAALGQFGRRWRALQPSLTRDPAWQPDGPGWRVAREVWVAWSPGEREAQLLSCLPPGHPRVSRRFLETVVGSKRPVRGGGWEWVPGRDEVSWRPVANPVGWFLVAKAPGELSGPGGRLRWSPEPAEGLAHLPGIDPGRPWSWRGEATRSWLEQDGLVRARWTREGWALVPAASAAGKLINRGIFVSLNGTE